MTSRRLFVLAMLLMWNGLSIFILPPTLNKFQRLALSIPVLVLYLMAYFPSFGGGV